MQRPYDEVTILDLTHDLGRYAPRLFANLGASVVRVEPPAGLPDRQKTDDGQFDEAARHEFAFFNAGKTSCVIDCTTPTGREAFVALAAHAQCIFLERGGPLYDDVAWVRAIAPRAVITSIAPYGRTGPLADAPSTDLTLQAAGGIAWLSGRVGEPPLRLPGSQATMVTGVYAAASTAIALWHVERDATGADTDPAPMLDISTQECIAHSLQNSIQVYDFEHRISMRGGEGTRDASEDLFACKDGKIFLAAPRALGQSWNALVAWIRETGHAAGEEFAKPCWEDRVWRMSREAKALFRQTLEPFTCQFTKEALVREGLARKIVLGPAATLQDVLVDPQLQHTRYFHAIQRAGRNEASALHDPLSYPFPGAPFRLSEDVWTVAPAPVLGESRVAEPL